MYYQFGDDFALPVVGNFDPPLTEPEAENPFEGGPNDVPITTISRGIEIDLREMIDQDPEKIPAPIKPQYDTQT